MDFQGEADRLIVCVCVCEREGDIEIERDNRETWGEGRIDGFPGGGR